MSFVEAFRQFQFRVKRENFCLVHVSLVPQVREKKNFVFIALFNYSSRILLKNIRQNQRNIASKNFVVMVYHLTLLVQINLLFSKDQSVFYSRLSVDQQHPCQLQQKKKCQCFVKWRKSM
jgi:hypothetical protein